MARPKIRNELRAWLRAWPEGEMRTFNEVYADVKCCIHKGFASRTIANVTHAGWLELLRNGDYRRTAQFCPPAPRPREKRVVGPSAGPFPWREREHWAMLQAGAWRAPITVTAKIAGDQLDVHTYRSRPPRDQWERPVLIHTPTQLNHARKWLHACFDSRVKLKPRRRNACSLGWLDRSYAVGGDFIQVVSTGLGVRTLLLELCMEPEFDDTGEFVRFRSIDPTFAAEELAQLYDTELLPDAKYHAYMEHRCLPAPT